MSPGMFLKRFGSFFIDFLSCASRMRSSSEPGFLSRIDGSFVAS